MNRSPLVRRTPLKRSSQLRRSPLRRTGILGRRARVKSPTEAERAWKAPVWGRCECGCGRVCRPGGPPLHRHHVLLAQIVRREGADVWALRNSMLLHPDCHAGHHSGARKLLVSMVPDGALEFCVDVLGEHRAAEYLRRRYTAGRGEGLGA